MADSTKSSNDVQYLGLLSLALIIAGLGIHSFIVVVNVIDWWKGRSVTPFDHVVTALVISRMCAQCADMVYLFVTDFCVNNLYPKVILVILAALYPFYIYANIWLTSLLSIVFCLKISTLRTRLFLYLRRMIEQRTAYFIVASVLLAAFCAFLPVFPVIIMVSKGGIYNMTMDELVTPCTHIHLLYSQTTGAFIPLLFCCISSVLLFSSLYHHTRRMKMSGNLSINLKAYYSVMTFLSFAFIYNTIYFTAYVVILFYYFLYCVDLLWLHNVIGFLPFLHSSYLIYRTAKLRSQMSKVLQKVIDFLFQRKDPETREEIEIIAQ